jgi:hypothetical protein
LKSDFSIADSIASYYFLVHLIKNSANKRIGLSLEEVVVHECIMQWEQFIRQTFFHPREKSIDDAYGIVLENLFVTEDNSLVAVCFVEVRDERGS